MREAGKQRGAASRAGGIGGVEGKNDTARISEGGQAGGKRAGSGGKSGQEASGGGRDGGRTGTGGSGLGGEQRGDGGCGRGWVRARPKQGPKAGRGRW
jgi:hypothetical protein